MTIKTVNKHPSATVGNKAAQSAPALLTLWFSDHGHAKLTTEFTMTLAENPVIISSIYMAAFNIICKCYTIVF
jgi:hypothetical protein